MHKDISLLHTELTLKSYNVLTSTTGLTLMSSQLAKFSPEANSLWPLNVDAAKLDSENFVSKIG